MNLIQSPWRVLEACRSLPGLRSRRWRACLGVACIVLLLGSCGGHEQAEEATPRPVLHHGSKAKPTSHAATAEALPPHTAEAGAIHKPTAKPKPGPPIPWGSPAPPVGPVTVPSVPVTEPANPFAAVDQVLAQLRTANLAFNAPPTLTLGETAEIQLRLSLDKTIAELQGELTFPGQAEGASAKVSDRMEARLTGANFQITAITSEEQSIGNHGSTEWQWDIQPTARGPQKLHLTLTALFDVGGETLRKSVRTFDAVIDVQVTPKQVVTDFLKQNWQWLWAAIFLPVLAGVWKFLRAKKSRRARRP